MGDTQNKKKVLVVDDDDNLRLVLSDKLTSAGFDVEGAGDGVAGLDKALAWHPDVILLDVVMPKMNGWETLDKLRADSWGKNANVVMLTVLEDTENIARAVGKGSYSYLLKTNYNLDEVVKAVKQSLNK